MSGCGVREFFKSKNVLVTGATGFVGKAVVEKLLRSCPQVESVYILVRTRPGTGISVQTRLDELLSNPVFDVLKAIDNGAALKKIIPIYGDLEQPSLGLSDADRNKLISDVSVVIHAAAFVRFDESAHKSVQINVNGTRMIMELCRHMKKLQALVHISTAYSNCTESTIEEKVYSPPEGALDIIKGICEEEGSKKNLENVVLAGHPNIYTYTKAIGEHFVALEAQDLPVCIVRPSIVTASLSEPMPGWNESLNGATSIIVGIGLGALRIIMGNPAIFINLVPVDFVANLILCAAWETHLRDTTKLKTSNDRPQVLPIHPVKVYNCCASEKNPLTLNNLFRQVKLCTRIICPFSKAARYPTISGTRHRVVYMLKDFVYQYIPALLMDTFSGAKNAKALETHAKLKRAAKALSYFTLNEWRFPIDNLQNLYDKLSPEEQQCFMFNMETIDWQDYIQTYCWGVRRYIMKEDDSTLREAHVRMHRFFEISVYLKTAFFVSLALALIIIIITVMTTINVK